MRYCGARIFATYCFSHKRKFSAFKFHRADYEKLLQLYKKNICSDFRQPVTEARGTIPTASGEADRTPLLVPDFVDPSFALPQFVQLLHSGELVSVIANLARMNHNNLKRKDGVAFQGLLVAVKLHTIHGSLLGFRLYIHLLVNATLHQKRRSQHGHLSLSQVWLERSFSTLYHP